jgi:hypothetical protein
MSFHRNTSPERVLAKTVATAASLQPSAPGYQRRKSRGCLIVVQTNSGKYFADRFREYFVSVVLREATVSAAKENGCNVGTANDPAQPRGRIGSGEANYADGETGCQDRRRFLCLWGCLPFGRGERSLCVGRTPFLRVGRHPDGYAPELAQRQVGYWSATRGREGNGNLNSAGVDRHSIPARPR